MTFRIRCIARFARRRKMPADRPCLQADRPGRSVATGSNRFHRKRKCAPSWNFAKTIKHRSCCKFKFPLASSYHRWPSHSQTIAVSPVSTARQNSPRRLVAPARRLCLPFAGYILVPLMRAKPASETGGCRGQNGRQPARPRAGEPSWTFGGAGPFGAGNPRVPSSENPRLTRFLPEASTCGRSSATTDRVHGRDSPD